MEESLFHPEEVFSEFLHLRCQEPIFQQIETFINRHCLREQIRISYNITTPQTIANKVRKLTLR